MAKNLLRQDLIEKSFAYQVYGKRFCDLTKEERREYNRIKKRLSREKNGNISSRPRFVEDMLSGRKYS